MAGLKQPQPQLAPAANPNPLASLGLGALGGNLVKQAPVPQPVQNLIVQQQEPEQPMAEVQAGAGNIQEENVQLPAQNQRIPEENAQVNIQLPPKSK